MNTDEQISNPKIPRMELLEEEASKHPEQETLILIAAETSNPMEINLPVKPAPELIESQCPISAIDLPIPCAESSSQKLVSLHF